MANAVIDGITTRYEVVGSGEPLLMFSPGGFDATLDKWSTLGVYARIRVLEHLSRTYSCIIFDRRETGQSGGRVERVTWADYVKQGKGLLDHLNIPRAHINRSARTRAEVPGRQSSGAIPDSGSHTHART